MRIRRCKTRVLPSSSTISNATTILYLRLSPTTRVGALLVLTHLILGVLHVLYYCSTRLSRPSFDCFFLTGSFSAHHFRADKAEQVWTCPAPPWSTFPRVSPEEQTNVKSVRKEEAGTRPRPRALTEIVEAVKVGKVKVVSSSWDCATLDRSLSSEWGTTLPSGRIWHIQETGRSY